MDHGPKIGSSSVAQDVTAYIAAASRHGRATLAGDARAAETAYLEIAQRWKTLSSSTARWEPTFLALLADQNPWVRLWAASHALHLDEAQATAVLERLGGEPGVLGSDARMTLEVWQRSALAAPA